MTRRSGALKTAALAAALLFGFALRARAQSTDGYVDIIYYEWTDEVLAFATTYPDYDTSYYYDPRVQVTLYKNDYDWVGQNSIVGITNGPDPGGYAAISVSTPFTSGDTYSAYGEHCVDAYYYYEVNPNCQSSCYDWYDCYGYGSLLWAPTSSWPAWTWYPPLIEVFGYMATNCLGPTAMEGFAPPPPTLSCDHTSVTRGSEVTCTVSGAAATRVTGWSFSGGGATVNGPSGVTSGHGPMVQSGDVSVTLSGLASPQPQSITVNNRSWLSDPPGSDQVPEGTPVNCSPGLAFGPYPEEGSRIGASCPYGYFNVTPGTVSGGPNDGFHFVTSTDHSGSYFKWGVYPPLQVSGSAFYQAQCGNWVPPSGPGFTSGATLRANVERHEGGSYPSHYAYFFTAWTDASLNPEAVAEAQVGRGGTQNSFRTAVLELLSQKFSTIQSQTATEPCGTNNANYNASCVYGGNANMYKWRSGQFELDSCP